MNRTFWRQLQIPFTKWILVSYDFKEQKDRIQAWWTLLPEEFRNKELREEYPDFSNLKIIKKDLDRSKIIFDYDKHYNVNFKLFSILKSLKWLIFFLGSA